MSFNELLESVFLYGNQVFYHAHSKTSPVPFIDSSQSLAWKPAAFITKSQLASGEFGAVLFQKRALLVSGSAAHAANNFDSFASDAVSERQVSSA